MPCRPALARLAVATPLAALLACGGDGGGGGGGGTTDPPILTSIDVTPSSATLTSIGEDRQLQAVARDQSNRQMSGVSFTWSSSDESVATVGQDGFVTAEDNGNATIRARADGVEGSASVTVDQAPATVAVSPDATTLTAIDATEQFTAGVYDALGSPVTDASGTVTWSSSNESVAMVDASGLATARDNGEALISAATEGVAGDASLMVGQEPASVALTPESTTLTDVRTTRQLSATALDGEGNPIDGVTFDWISSDTTTATVDDTGLVTSVREGTVEIEARVGGVGATAGVTVDLPPGRVVWIPGEGGSWSRELNWSCKCKPGVGEEVSFADDGTYTVTVDIDAEVSRIDVGGASGSKTLLLPPGRVLDISAGSDVNTNGTVVLDGGHLAGAGRLTNRGLIQLREALVSAPVENQGTLEVGGEAAGGSPAPAPSSWASTRLPGESVIEGELTTTSTSVIRIAGDEDLTGGGSPALLTVADGFSNAGIIELITRESSSEARLEVMGSGVLENLGELVGRSEDGGSGTNQLLAKLDNKGTVSVLDQSFLLKKESAVHRNEGTVAVGGGELLVEQSGTDPAFTNVGTVDVSAGATLTTDGGTLAHAEGARLQGAGRVRLHRSALDLDADLTVAEGEVELDGSDVAGVGQLRNEGTLVLTDGSRVVPTLQNAGTLRVLSTSTDPGTVLESRIEGPFETEGGSLIQVGDEADQGADGASPTVLVVADGFVNNGLLELITESNSSEARVRVEGSGLLENAGEIVNRGAGGGVAQNLLEAALKNSGDVRVATSKLRLDKFGAEHTNEADGRLLVEQGEMRLKLTGDSPVFTNRSAATLDILAGASLVTDEGNLINESGGVIQGDGTLGVEQAGVSLTDALTLTGTIRMSDGTLTGPGLVVQGTLELEGFSYVDVPVEVADGGTLALHAPVADPSLPTDVEMVGTLTTHPGSTIELVADGTAGTVLSLFNDLTNQGTLALVNGSAGGEALMEVGTGQANALVNDGELVSRADGGSGTNRIDANLTNNGTVSVPSETLVVSPSFGVDANHANAAEATVVVGEAGGAAARLTLTGASPESIDNFGTVTVHAAGTLALGASTLNRPEGRIQGDGTIEAQLGLTSRGTIAPGVGGPGILTVDGNLTLEEALISLSGDGYASSLQIEVGGESAGSEHDRLDVTGEAVLAGFLSVSQIDGFVPVENDEFAVMTYGSGVNDFLTVTRDVEGADLEWSGSPGATSYILTAIQP